MGSISILIACSSPSRKLKASTQFLCGEGGRVMRVLSPATTHRTRPARSGPSHLSSCFLIPLVLLPVFPFSRAIGYP